MRRLIIGCTLIGLTCFALRAVAEDAPPKDSSTGGHEYNLTSYLKGTAPQIRDRLNGEVERLIGRVKETQSAIADCNKDISGDAQVAIEKIRKSDVYRQTLAEKTNAEQELEAARKTGTPQERLDAGSRFNKARMALEKLEADAIAHYEPLTQDHSRSYDLQRQLIRFKESLVRAIGWRDELLHAIRTTYAMRGPVKDGSRGILPEVTILKVLDGDHLLVKYEAAELMSKGKEAEGIQSYSARYYHTTILVDGIDTSKLKVADKIDIDRSYVIDSTSHTEEKGTIFSGKHSPDDTEALFDAIVPLRLSPDSVGKAK